MIKVTNLSYTYPKSSDTTLKNLTFEIDQGEIFGFLGPSGAGKSTTQKILYKILHNFEGEAFRKKSLDSLVVSVRDKIKQLSEEKNPLNEAEIAKLGELEVKNHNKHKDELIDFIEKNMGTSIAVYPTSLAGTAIKMFRFWKN
jgi:ABC-type Na+ transport system ATPase subunit NatA